MYAVVSTGGKQYHVEKGSLFKVEKLDGKVGEKITLKEILLVGGNGDLKLGRPTVTGASITCIIAAQDRAEKIMVFKKKRRKGYQKRHGHRQYFTALKVEEIKE